MRKILGLIILAVLLACLAVLIKRGVEQSGGTAAGTALSRKADAAPPVVKAAAAGQNRTIVLMSDGTIWKWGGGIYNEGGFNSAVPSGVIGLSDVIVVAGGMSHNVALKSDGTVWAWGYNGEKQLGDGTDVIRRSEPRQVRGLTDIIAIASGENHTVALKKDGTIWTWGDNRFGQLGNGTKSNKQVPDTVIDPTGAPFTGVLGIAAGAGHTIVLKKDGTVWAWGNNRFGQLGDGTTADHLTPVQVVGLTDAVAIACGYAHSIAVKSDGTIWTWGSDSYGQLGEGTAFPIVVKNANHSLGIDGTSSQSGAVRKTFQSTPVQVQGLSDVIAIAGGREHTVAIKKDGTVWAWGNNFQNQLGIPGVRRSPVPLPVPGLTEATGISAGYEHTVAVTSDGTLWAWGFNKGGQLGDRTKTNRSFPIAISVVPRRDISHSGQSSEKPARPPFPSNIIAIAAGGHHSIALSRDGTVWTWGNNAQGQLGDGSTENSSVPVRVEGLADVIAIAGGYTHTLVLKKDGTVWAWGNNTFGQLGDGTKRNSAVPVQVKGLTNVSAVSGGGCHSAALKRDGTVWTWGNNEYGQLGNGTVADSAVPVHVEGVARVTAVAAGGYHTVVFRNDNTVWTWGNNSFGQLGDATTIDRHTPVQVKGLDEATSVIAAGTYHTAVLRKWNGKVSAWGNNEFGQVGDGTLDNTATPVLVQALTRGMPQFSDNFLTGIISVACGGDHTIALMNGGRIWLWGRGNYGQTGPFGRLWENSSVAAGSPSASGEIIAVVGGYEHTVVLSRDGTVRTWGSNEYGQLGNAEAYDRSESIQVK
jgi:alpha-tubulin suppressor-like RCC1 family protein